MERLKRLLTREHDLGTRIHRAYISRTASEVGPNLRDKAMSWLRVLNENFRLQPESFVLAVHIFDKFLLTTKVRVKYLRCVAIAAYFISIKAVEEDENIPVVSDLLETSQCGCSKSDILKMELIILKTIEWKIYAATPMRFLQHFYEMLFVPYPSEIKNIPEKFLAEAEGTIQECMCKWQLTQFKSSVLAYAVLINTFQGVLGESQLQIIQDIIKIENKELFQCKLLLKEKTDNHTISVKELETVDVIHTDSKEKLKVVKT
ncbi:cyclin-I-like [Dendronephthya gigantea]|uniref:cyclin-I-like n=1 Tax=Dendronephthya gigantea TaxID=151771 RepID=UPI001068F529|nr:cyclin-I-like [Dendronephthya gigantea]